MSEFSNAGVHQDQAAQALMEKEFDAALVHYGRAEQAINEAAVQDWNDWVRIKHETALVHVLMAREATDPGSRTEALEGALVCLEESERKADSHLNGHERDVNLAKTYQFIGRLCSLGMVYALRTSDSGGAKLWRAKGEYNFKRADELWETSGHFDELAINAVLAARHETCVGQSQQAAHWDERATFGLAMAKALNLRPINHGLKNGERRVKQERALLTDPITAAAAIVAQP